MVADRDVTTRDGEQIVDRQGADVVLETRVVGGQIVDRDGNPIVERDSDTITTRGILTPSLDPVGYEPRRRRFYVYG